MFRHITTVVTAAAMLSLAGCASSPALPLSGAAQDADFPHIDYATWTDAEPPYRLYPGDQLEVRVPSAPELSQKVLTVQPDGRISMPLIGQAPVADLTLPDAEAMLAQAYASQLVHPNVEVAVTTAAPIRIFVGGEVDKPGVYDMPGPIDSLQAVIQAGGFKTSARTTGVIIIRRGADGRAMMRTANLGAAIHRPGVTDAVPLRRFDIVYVPRSGIAQIGLFMQQYLREALPISFSYAINGSYNN